MKFTSAMKILGLDTTTMAGSVGLIEDERPIAAHTLHIQITHSERIMEAIDVLLKGAKVPLRDLDGFAVSVGPGSFTGLRVGLGVIKGLAMATGRKVVPVSSLHALACNLSFAPYPICPVIDARKKEVYSALFRGEADGKITRLTGDRLMSASELLRGIGAGLPGVGEQDPVLFFGDGADLHRDLIRSVLGPRAIFPPPWTGIPSGVMVSLLGRRGFLEGKEIDGEDLVPEYIQEFP